MKIVITLLSLLFALSCAQQLTPVKPNRRLQKDNHGHGHGHEDGTSDDSDKDHANEKEEKEEKHHTGEESDDGHSDEDGHDDKKKHGDDKKKHGDEEHSDLSSDDENTPLNRTKYQQKVIQADEKCQKAVNGSLSTLHKDEKDEYVFNMRAIPRLLNAAMTYSQFSDETFTVQVEECEEMTKKAECVENLYRARKG